MNNRSYRTLTAIVVMAGISSGCQPDLFPPTMYDVKLFAAKERAALKEHDTNMTEQHIRMSPEAETEIRKLQEKFQTELARIGKETDAIKGKAAQALEEAVSVAADVAGKFFGVNLPLNDFVNGKIGDTEARLVSTINNTADDMEDEFKDELALLREQLKDNELATQLSDGNLQALNSTVEARRGEIEAALNDPAKLRSTVLTIAREGGLDPQTIKALEKAGDDDLLSMILTLLGGGALGGMASRFGPSRSQKETDEVKRKLELLESALALGGGGGVGVASLAATAVGRAARKKTG